MHKTPDDLFAYLAGLGITAETHHHPALRTVADSKRLRGDLPGGHCKNLFLKDKKKQLWLIVALEDAVIDLKALRHTIGAANLSFGKPDLLLDTLGVVPGSVSPFALLNDPGLTVNVVLDAKMMALDMLNYHPLTNTMTTAISSADLARFIASIGHDALHVDLDHAAPLAPAP